jgi:hypothetical protein
VAALARPDAARAVLDASHRVRPIARWRLRAVRVFTSMLLALSVGTWLLSTDEIDALAAVVVGHPVHTVATHGLDAVAVIVRSPVGEIPAAAATLHRAGVSASFASTVAPDRATLVRLAALGDSAMPAIKRSSLFGWIHTPAELRRDARKLHLEHRFFYLAAPNATLGQILLARVDGAVAVDGSVQLSSRAPRPLRALRPGDVVVVTLAGSAGSSLMLERIVSLLRSDGLSGLSFSTLAR